MLLRYHILLLLLQTVLRLLANLARPTDDHEYSDLQKLGEYLSGVFEYLSIKWTLLQLGLITFKTNSWIIDPSNNRIGLSAPEARMQIQTILKAYKHRKFQIKKQSWNLANFF